jgi:hypothetical protein
MTWGHNCRKSHVGGATCRAFSARRPRRVGGSFRRASITLIAGGLAKRCHRIGAHRGPDGAIHQRPPCATHGWPRRDAKGAPEHNQKVPAPSSAGTETHHFSSARNSSTGIAVSVWKCAVPRAPSSIETRAITFSSGASTMLTKS